MLLQLSIEPPLQTQLYHKKGHSLQALHTIGKDCLLLCSGHPHWYCARRLLCKSQAYPTQPQNVIDMHHPEQKMRNYHKHNTVKTTKSISILRLPQSLKDNQYTMSYWCLKIYSYCPGNV